MLWNLVFSLFWVVWVMASSVRETLLGCPGTFWTKNERSRGLSHCVHFGHYVREGTGDHLKAKKMPNQALITCLYSLLLWDRL